VIGWESVVLLLSIWLLFLLLAIYYLSEASFPSLSRWRETVSEHVSADGRARALLRELLDESEYQQLTRLGYLDVASPRYDQRIYRIPGAGGLVRVYERGTAIMELCLQPAEPLPENDVIALHKLMIEGNEEEYLARANHFAPGIISLRCHL
jgi:hypothetical protein